MPRTTDQSIAIDIKVGNIVAGMRLSRGWSRKQLGDQIGVTHQQVQKYEKGLNRISVGRLTLFAKAFNMPVGDFFDEQEFELDLNQRLSMEIQRNLGPLTLKMKRAICDLVRSMCLDK